jgi:twitching motility protein PilT
VILIGEMRDTETVRAALQAAETGHLVLSTLHTTDATETVNRVIDFFPPYQQKQVRLAWRRASEASSANGSCRPSTAAASPRSRSS